MKVVIVGGGFCGALVAKLLDKHEELEITLIDKKDYFEYTPSIHKVISNPEFHKKIIVPFSHFLKRTRIVTDKLKQVTPTFVETENEKISFDYLVVSSGIDYPIRLENKENVFALKNGADVVKMGEKIVNSEHILIVGGGLIGVEVAGELVTKSKGKRIVIVHPKDRLLERNPTKASKYAKKFLEKRGVQIIFGERVVDHVDNNFITDKGRKIDAETCLWCAGIKCNPSFMNGFKDILSERNSLKVNSHLQLSGYPNIFVGGDINNIPEEKTAHNAERQAHLIVKNIQNLIQKKPLLKHKIRFDPLLISLGDWTALMPTSKFVLTGVLPAIMKNLVEWWILRSYK